MPTDKKRPGTSKQFSAEEIAAAKAAAEPAPAQAGKDWNKATVTRGGGVEATIGELRRTRGPNRKPTKEQVAIRIDSEILVAFRAGGPGWQTRMNTALKEWLAHQPSTAKAKRTS